MPYITSLERIGYRRGLRQGIELGLKLRFGEEGLKLMPLVRQEIYESEQLDAVVKALDVGASLDEIRRLLAPIDS